MKKIIEIILLIVGIGNLFLLNSCNESFLEKQPAGSATEIVLETSEGVEGLLVGAYDLLTGNDAFACLDPDWVFGDCASDDAYKGSTVGDQSADFNPIERYEVLPTNNYLAYKWRDCYDGVSRANDVLRILWKTQEGDNPISENRAKEIEAEAKFLRAWYHFKANRIFEKIPYIKTDKELDGIKPEEIPNNSEGWNEIEADLQFAVDNLPTTHPKGEVGRVHKYAAMSVKAYVHLFQGEFNEAKPLLDNIINNGNFKLVDNYEDNYRSETENNEESIFEIQVSGTPVDAGGINANNLGITMVAFHNLGPAGGGWGFFQPSQNLFEAFQTKDGLPVLDQEERDVLANDMGIESSDEFIPTNHELDPRVDWTIARRGIDFLGWGIHQGKSWIRSQSNGGPYMTKKYMHHRGETTSQGGKKNVRNFRAYRYSHVLLWRAEVAVEDGDLDLARQLVNEIRNRAKNSQYVMGFCSEYILNVQPDKSKIDWTKPAANYVIEPYPIDADAFSSKEEARKAVRLEQRLEFATEGMRFFDLRRWGIANEVLNSFIEEDNAFRGFLQGASFDPDKDDYWPLPQIQLDLQDVLEQDPAY